MLMYNFNFSSHIHVDLLHLVTDSFNRWFRRYESILQPFATLLLHKVLYLYRRYMTRIQQDSGITWILHESEAFIGKASKGDVVVFYFESLATQHMKASGSPEG